jgi:hypothetical protein
MSEDLPNVSRPRGSAWRQLQHEGICWEGQVLIPGGQADLAALLVVTEQRLALVRGGIIALDIPRDWLIDSPTIRRTGTVNLQIEAPGASAVESMSLVVREGRLASAELVEILAKDFSDDFPTWPYSNGHQEAPAPLPVERTHLSQKLGWEMPAAELEAPRLDLLEEDDFPPIAPPPNPMPDWSGGPAMTGDAAPAGEDIPSLRNTDWNLKPIAGLESRQARARRTTILRFAALLLIIAIVAAFRSGILPGWGDIRGAFDSDDPPIEPLAQVTLSPTQPPAESAQSLPTATRTAAPDGPSSTEPKPTLTGDERTAAALGVGGMSPSREPTNNPTETPGPTEAPTEKPQPTATTNQPVGASSTEVQSQNSSVSDGEPAEPSPTVAIVRTPVIPPPSATRATSERATEAPATNTAAPTATNEAQPDQLDEFPATGTASPSSDENQSNSEESAVSGPLRYTIDDVSTGQSLPDLTLGPLDTDQWVVITLTVQNESDELASLAMADFRLSYGGDSSVELPLDEATGAVSSFLGYSPQLAATDEEVLQPRASQEIVLVFAPPSDATGLVLLAGDARIDLEADAARTDLAMAVLMSATVQAAALRESTESGVTPAELTDSLVVPCSVSSADGLTPSALDGKAAFIKRAASARAQRGSFLWSAWSELGRSLDLWTRSCAGTSGSAA